MDGTFVQKLVELVGLANRDIVVRPDGEPDDVYLLKSFGADGNVQWTRTVAEAKPRSYRFYGLEDLIAAIGEETQPVTVLVSREQVMALIGEGRRERFTLRLPLTAPAEVYERLVRLPVSLPPREVAKWLQRDFEGVPGEVIGLLRKAKFEGFEECSDVVTKSTDAIGASVRRAAMFGDGGELPEELLIDLPVFGDTQEIRELTTQPVRFRLSLNLEGKQIEVRGDADGWRNAVVAALGKIAERIDTDTADADLVRVYLGSLGCSDSTRL